MEKVSQMRTFIHDVLARAQNPAVLCSFGKDSCTMLHFIREQQPNIPVIYFRAFDHPTKHRFADAQIQSLGLNVVEPLPYFRDVISNGETVQVVEAFAPGVNLHFPIEAESNFLPNALSHCALEKLQVPTSDHAWNYDCLFIGHRGDDTDPFWGEIGADRAQVAHNGVTFVYPLLDWTEADIWEASRQFNVPQNTARYAGEMSANNDYYPLCTNCLKPTGEARSWCPKTGGMIRNVADAAGVVNQASVWKSRFVNLKEQSA